MEIMHADLRKQTLRNWKAQDWIEHASFGLGQISGSREDKLDIDFVGGGRKTILKSTELKFASRPTPDFKFPKVKIPNGTDQGRKSDSPTSVDGSRSEDFATAITQSR